MFTKDSSIEHMATLIIQNPVFNELPQGTVIWVKEMKRSLQELNGNQRRFGSAEVAKGMLQLRNLGWLERAQVRRSGDMSFQTTSETAEAHSAMVASDD